MGSQDLLKKFRADNVLLEFLQDKVGTMKRIGLLGGMSLESTLTYITGFRDGVRERLGGLHSPHIVLVSVDFAAIEALQKAGDWERLGEILANHAQEIERGGADFLLLATNTMHKVAPAIQKAITIPFVHLAEATAERALSMNLNKVGLLGTRFTMEDNFYAGLLRERGIQVLVPDVHARMEIHRIIYDELCKGTVRNESHLAYQRTMHNLVEQGAQAIILGCTEIGLLVHVKDCSVPLLDTTRIHIEKGLDLALGIN